MSAPLTLDSDNLRSLADALDGLTDTTRKTGVDLSNHGMAGVEIAGVTLQITYDFDAEKYRLDDRIGA